MTRAICGQGCLTASVGVVERFSLTISVSWREGSQLVEGQSIDGRAANALCTEATMSYPLSWAWCAAVSNGNDRFPAFLRSLD